MFLIFDKNLLFDGVSIGKVTLCVKSKAITRYAIGAGIPFLRKIRDVNREETGGRLDG